MFFLLFLLDDRRIRIRIRISDYWIWIRETKKHMDPKDPDSDPDPQHCFNIFLELSAGLLDQKLTCGTACHHILSLHIS